MDFHNKMEERMRTGGNIKNGGNNFKISKIKRSYHSTFLILPLLSSNRTIELFASLLFLQFIHLPPITSFPASSFSATRTILYTQKPSSSSYPQQPQIRLTAAPVLSSSSHFQNSNRFRLLDSSHPFRSCNRNRTKKNQTIIHTTSTGTYNHKPNMGRWNQSNNDVDDFYYNASQQRPFDPTAARSSHTNTNNLMTPFLFGNHKNFKIYPRSHFVATSAFASSTTRCYASPSDDNPVFLGQHLNDDHDEEEEQFGKQTENEDEDDGNNKFHIATGLLNADSTQQQSSFNSPTMLFENTLKSNNQQRQQQPLSEISLDQNSTLSSLPPLPKFLIEDEDDYEETTNPPTSTNLINNHDRHKQNDNNDDDINDNGETTKLQIEQQQKQIDLLMEMVKSQQMQVQQQLQIQQQMSTKTNTVSPSSASSVLMDNSVQEESDVADGDAIYFTNQSINLPQQQLSPNSDNTSTTTTIVTPLKAMVFIDGTWLYYSLHHRREDDCPIIRKFGKGWQHKYKFDWAALPRIICEQMQMQQTNQGWSSNAAIIDPNTESSIMSNRPPGQQQSPTIQRPVEIVRASVFTSYKKTTDPQSIRVRMYEEMAAANYDVHMMETVGKGEKCVDIQLAVEMLHYATVPDAYDVAILLSGDKDFVPAMVRTRQKGRKVGVVSMRTGCNKALYEGTHVKDFDVVWIEDFLDHLLVPMNTDELNSRKRGKTQPDNYESSVVSYYTIIKVIHDFVQNSPSGRVSSRDIGRYLKSTTIGPINMLDDLKLNFGGLKQFLVERVPFIFTVINRDWDEVRDSRDRTFWVEVNENSMEALLEEAKKTQFSDDEKIFWSNYDDGVLSNGDSQAYYHTEEIIASEDDVDDKRENHQETTKTFTIPPELKKDYSKSTVAQLKEVCRERKLPVSGTKAVLLERIETDVEKQIKSLYEKFTNRKKETDSYDRQNQRIRTDMTRSKMGSRLLSKPHNGSGNTEIKSSTPNLTSRFSPTNRNQVHVNPAITQYLEELVKEYLKASGGQAGSRDVGRYLAANRVSGVTNNNGQKRMTALQELKDNYGSLANFIGSKNNVFLRVRETTPSRQQDDYGFPIMLNPKKTDL